MLSSPHPTLPASTLAADSTLARGSLSSPATFYTVARGRHNRLALRARVGLWLPGLASADVLCGGCKTPVDACGMHYGSCKNRGNMWTVRHDIVETALISMLCYLRLRAR